MMYPKARGIGIAAGSTETNLELLMRQLKERYCDDPELMVNAMSNLFGVVAQTPRCFALS